MCTFWIRRLTQIRAEPTAVLKAIEDRLASLLCNKRHERCHCSRRPKQSHRGQRAYNLIPKCQTYLNATLTIHDLHQHRKVLGCSVQIVTVFAGCKGIIDPILFAQCYQVLGKEVAGRLFCRSGKLTDKRPVPIGEDCAARIYKMLRDCPCDASLHKEGMCPCAEYHRDTVQASKAELDQAILGSTKYVLG
jgi:hypothetical protein